MILQVAKRIANIRLTLVRQTLKRFDYPLILSALFTLANQLAGSIQNPDNFTTKTIYTLRLL